MLHNAARNRRAQWGKNAVAPNMSAFTRFAVKHLPTPIITKMDQICATSGPTNYQLDIRQFLWSHRSETQTDLVLISGDKSFRVHQAVVLPLSDYLRELLPASCPCTKPAVCLPPFPSPVLTAAVEILYTGTTTIAASQEDQIKVKELFALLKIKADVDRDINIEATKKKIFQQVEEDLEAMFAGLEDSDTEKGTKKKTSSEPTSEEPKEKKGEFSTGTVSEEVIPKIEPNYSLAIPDNEQKVTLPHQDIHSCNLNEVTGVFHNDREKVSGLNESKSCKNHDEEPLPSFESIQSQGTTAPAIILDEVTGVFCYDDRQNDHENVKIVTGDDKVVKFDNDETESLKKHEITKCPKQAKRKNITTSYTFGGEEEHPSISSQTPKLRARKRKAKESDEVRKGIGGLDENLSSVSKPQHGNKKMKVTGLDGSILSSVMKPQSRNKKQKRSATTTYSCDKCDYVSKWKGNVKKHIIFAHEEIYYDCDKCDFRTVYKQSLHNHIDAMHLKKQKRSATTTYSCDKCDYVSKLKGNVKQHIKCVHEEIYYDCDKCDFRTVYKQNLQNHIDAMHLKISHECDQCDFTAKLKSTIKKHILSVHKNIYFNCDQCEFRTMWKISLKHHIDAHKNIYFKCDQCNYETAWKGNFKRHIEGAHENIAYNCNQCNFTTTWKKYLQRHIKSTHGEVSRSGYRPNPKAVDKPTVPSRKPVHREVAANCRTRSQKMAPDVAADVNSISRVSENPGPSNNKSEQKRFQNKSKAAFLW